MAKRLQAMGTPGYENGFQLVLLPERLDDPKRRKKPTVYFVNSMSDVFHAHFSLTQIRQVFDVIDAAFAQAGYRVPDLLRMIALSDAFSEVVETPAAVKTADAGQQTVAK